MSTVSDIIHGQVAYDFYSQGCHRKGVLPVHRSQFNKYLYDGLIKAVKKKGPHSRKVWMTTQAEITEFLKSHTGSPRTGSAGTQKTGKKAGKTGYATQNSWEEMLRGGMIQWLIDHPDLSLGELFADVAFGNQQFTKVAGTITVADLQKAASL